MRLIDADKLMEELHHMIERDADLRKDYEYLGVDDCIRSMPTAYNVDAVVEQLKRNSMPFMGDKTDRDVDLQKAIKIVKGGGVDGKANQI